jgi:catechol 2,3-dioxygenase-like lactoylglutathione lyase family enzyme
MPSLQINHFGISVRDIERSTEFYKLLGAEIAVETALFSGAKMDKGLGLEGVELKACMISFGGSLVELLEYVSPVGDDYASINANVGAPHLAFQVDDIQSLYDSLSDAGFNFLSEPVLIEDGPFVGGYFVYSVDPDGISVELIQPGPGFASAIASL